MNDVEVFYTTDMRLKQVSTRYSEEPELFNIEGVACIFDWDYKTPSVVKSSSHTKMVWEHIQVLPTLPSSQAVFFPGQQINSVPDFYYEWIDIVDDAIHRTRPNPKRGKVQVGGYISFIQDGDEHTALSAYDTEHGDCGQAYACIEKDEKTDTWSLNVFDQMY